MKSLTNRKAGQTGTALAIGTKAIGLQIFCDLSLEPVGSIGPVPDRSGSREFVAALSIRRLHSPRHLGQSRIFFSLMFGFGALELC